MEKKVGNCEKRLKTVKSGKVGGVGGVPRKTCQWKKTFRKKLHAMVQQTTTHNNKWILQLGG